MNLDADPTAEQLRELLRRCDDSAGHHVLWVNRTGEVQLSRVPKDQTAAGFEENHPELQLRYETFLAGNEYVGPEAADDDEWVSELHDSLLNEWRKAKGKTEVVYIDIDTLSYSGSQMASH